MSKKSTIDTKDPVLNQQPVPPPVTVNVPPLTTAAQQGGRPLKAGVRPNSPKANLHIPSVFA